MNDITSVTDPADDELSLVEIYDVLRDERRARTLSVLMRESTPVDTSTLARLVAADEATRESITSERVNKVHISLYHYHLPKLADMGLIENDESDITVTSAADRLRQLSF